MDSDRNGKHSRRFRLNSSLFCKVKAARFVWKWREHPKWTFFHYFPEHAAGSSMKGRPNNSAYLTNVISQVFLGHPVQRVLVQLVDIGQHHWIGPFHDVHQLSVTNVDHGIDPLSTNVASTEQWGQLANRHHSSLHWIVPQTSFAHKVLNKHNSQSIV